MDRSPLQQQVDSLPELVTEMIDGLITTIDAALSPALCRKLERVFVTGCGDSHHAAVASELAFEQLAGLPCEPMTAMQFGRYAAGYLPETGRGTNLVLAVSVSGQVSRTIEALEMGRKAGATAIALTGSPDSPLAGVADIVLHAAVPSLPDEPAGIVVPGTRSYIASLLALLLCAIHIGRQRTHLSQARTNRLRRELGGVADLMEHTISGTDPVADLAAASWQDVDQFVFCGSGPNYGTALFSAAKLLEASGDAAIAQDVEEWAHLQYFGRQTATPTFLISAGGWDEDRVLEVAEAAATIGRRLATIAPAESAVARSSHKGLFFPVAGPIRECFSPLLTCLAGALFAAYRARSIGEPYFRGFGGGRGAEGGGGISRIRTSQRIDHLNR
jgi:glucosamine--fructose-6-phosphate aminotransferase (isomerizing)